MTAIALIGAGKMGEALLAGLVDGGHSVVVCEPNEERAQTLRDRYGITTGDARQAAENAAVVIIAVKPPMVHDVVAGFADALAPETIVISVAAGIPTMAIEAVLPDATAVVRAMPNTPALVGQAMTVLSAGSSCSPEQLAIAQELLACVGAVAVVEEVDQDAVTALSGSGPAYVFLVIESLVDAALELGLDPETAHNLAVQTLYGAACMLRETGEQPAQLRINVTSPGGTTAAALEQLELFNVREAFLAALTAARNRSIELASPAH